jgi:2-methylisocitrate lyase-like PEP mutase family enzyme
LRKPVNVLGGLSQLSLAELSEIGVKRVSVGSSLNLAALGGFVPAAEKMKEHGTFAYATKSVPSSRFSAIFSTDSDSDCQMRGNGDPRRSTAAAAHCQMRGIQM